MRGKPFTLTRRGKIYYARFKLHDGSWSTAKSTREKTKGNAENWALEYLNRGSIVTREGVTLEAFANDFFSYDGEWALDRRVTGKRNTHRQCMEKAQILEARILPTLGKMKLTDITRDTVKTFRNDLYKRGLAGTTINHTLSTLKAILDAAEEKGLIQAVPRIERAAARHKDRGILTVDEVKRLFDVEWRDFRSYAANLAACSTGLRRGELQALTLDDIHGDYITVSKSWDERMRTVNQTTKTGRARTVIIPGKVKSVLLSLAAVNPYGRAGAFFVFFSSMPDKPLEGTVINRDLYRALKAIGIDETERKRRNLTFHSHRHFFNSLLINAKIPLTKIQSITGHLTDEMTAHYYHPDELTDVVEAVQTALFGGGDK